MQHLDFTIKRRPRDAAPARFESGLGYSDDFTDVVEARRAAAARHPSDEERARLIAEAIAAGRVRRVQVADAEPVSHEMQKRATKRARAVANSHTIGAIQRAVESRARRTAA